VLRSRRKKRRGAAVVETALVLLPLLMFVMSIFEFGRLFMAWNLLNNAARTGVRYALVNNTSTTITTDVTTQVTNRMAGQDTQAFSNFTVSVSGTHNGVSTPVNNLVAGDLITVTVSAKYRWLNVIPGISFGSLTITSAPTMVCEGAT
jgi:Flp pilus assembly protein TadG